MTKPTAEPVDVKTDALGVDIRVARSPRIGDYLLGGSDNFPIDRKVTDYITAGLPGGNDTARAIARATQACIGRIMRFLVDEVGIRQFLNIGTGIPTRNNMSEVAEYLTRQSRLVYVVSDPVVIAHARSLMSSAQHSIAYVHGSLREPEDILRQAAATLDDTQPVAVLAFRVLQLVESKDDDAVHCVVARLLDGLPSGSHLAITHLASDIHADQLTEAASRYKQMVRESKMATLVPRSHAEISRLFDGLELVDPGVVPTVHWRTDEPSNGQPTPPVYAAVGRQP